MKAKELSKNQVQRLVIFWEIAGFLIIILTCWMTELYDPPFSYQQVIIETALILLFGCLITNMTWKLIRRLKYLEGFLVICASCKQVRIDDAWVSIEHIISDRSDLLFSHGICPECTERLYGEYLRKSAHSAT
jgi:hypothetical protein